MTWSAFPAVGVSPQAREHNLLCRFSFFLIFLPDWTEYVLEGRMFTAANPAGLPVVCVAKNTMKYCYNSLHTIHSILNSTQLPRS